MICEVFSYIIILYTKSFLMQRGILIEIAATCYMIPDSKVHIEPKLNHSIIVSIEFVLILAQPTWAAQ